MAREARKTSRFFGRDGQKLMTKSPVRPHLAIPAPRGQCCSMSVHRKILMAEDNAQFAKAKAVSLQPAGFDVTVAHDGLEAWDYAQRIQFDVLLTDYDMPGLKGADLCRRLRRDRRYTSTPIILMTCFGRDLDVSRLGTELQLAAVLEKPFRTTELLSKIRECLAGDKKCSSAEDAQLGQIACQLEALDASVQSAVRPIAHGQRVKLLRGPLKGVQGTVVARRAAGRVLVQVVQGGYIEVSVRWLRVVD